MLINPRLKLPSAQTVSHPNEIELEVLYWGEDLIFYSCWRQRWIRIRCVVGVTAGAHLGNDMRRTGANRRSETNGINSYTTNIK